MKKMKFDLDDDELKATREFLGSLGKLFLVLIFLGTITGIIPILLCVLIENVPILIIPIILIDIIWIGKELYNCCMEGE